MSNIQIKRVPENVHAELRRRAEQSGTTVRDYVLGLIQRDLRLPSHDALRARIRSLDPVEPVDDPLETLHEERHSRGEQLDAGRRASGPDS